MARAQETAQLALSQINAEIPTKSDSILEEGAPYPPEPSLPNWRPHQQVCLKGGVTFSLQLVLGRLYSLKAGDLIL